MGTTATRPLGRANTLSETTVNELGLNISIWFREGGHALINGNWGDLSIGQSGLALATISLGLLLSLAIVDWALWRRQLGVLMDEED